MAATAVRLIAITQPFIDQWSWRQSDVAAIARNFAANGFHFAKPQIDWAGDAPGYVGTEFPVLSFAAAIAYSFAGEHEWIGRLQAVLFFAASLPFFYLLVRDVAGERAAVWGAFFYGFAPLSIAAGRAFMPDVPSLSLAIIGLYFYTRWLETGRPSAFVGSAAAVSLAILIKAPTAVIGAPLLYLTWQRFGARFWSRPAVWLYGTASLLPSVLWYWHAHRVAATFYPYHLFGAGGFQIMDAAWYLRIARQTALSSLTLPLTFAALAGAFVVPRSKDRLLFHWWALAMIAFIFVTGWGNRHQWYQLPLVPIAAAFAGAGCVALSDKITRARGLAIALFICGFTIFATVATRPFFAPAAAALRDLGIVLERSTPPGSLIVAADDGDPTIFYYARRKGWHFLEKDGVFYGNPLDDAQLIGDFDSLRRRGARYIVFPFGTRWWLDYYAEFAAHLRAVSREIELTPERAIYEITPP